MLSARSESASAVEASAAQRFGWAEAAARPQVVAVEALVRAQQLVGGRALQLLPLFRADVDAVRAWAAEGREIARAARWVDALPFKIDAQDGGLSLTLRLRGS